MPTRYFEFVSGTSAKFWEISTSGSQVTIRFGRIGTQGQTQVKTLADARLITTGKDMVEVAHEALIREWPVLRKWLDEIHKKMEAEKKQKECVYAI